MPETDVERIEYLRGIVEQDTALILLIDQKRIRVVRRARALFVLVDELVAWPDLLPAQRRPRAQIIADMDAERNPIESAGEEPTAPPIVRRRDT